MNQHDFDILLQKYLAGECSRSEEKLITEWSENMLKYGEIKMHEKEKELIGKRIMQRLTIREKPSALFSKSWFLSGIAASLLIAVIASASFFVKPGFLPAKSTFANALHYTTAALPSISGNIEIKNTSQKSYEIKLTDDTRVTLKPGSSLSYPEHFDNKLRKVYLDGEALFNVKKDPSRPFLVHTGDLVTQVLGTSFIVKSYEMSKSIEVEVITGRVSVYEKSQKSPQSRNGIILIPNQKIIFDKMSKTLVPELVSEPVIVEEPAEKSQFVFEETLLPQVLSMLQKAYGIEIVIETASLNGCEFTGDINDLPLYSQLKMICRAVNADYELRGTTFFLNGEGCKD